MSLTAITTSYSAFTETAVLVQSQLRRVGVVMDLQVLDQALVRSRLATGDFDALFNFIGAGANTHRYFGGDSPVGYRKAEVITLIDRALDTADPDLEDAIYRDLATIFRVDVPATYLSPRVETVFAHRRIRGLSSPFRASPNAHMEELWMEDQGAS